MHGLREGGREREGEMRVTDAWAEGGREGGRKGGTFRVGGLPSKTNTGLMPEESMRMVRLKSPWMWDVT